MTITEKGFFRIVGLGAVLLSALGIGYAVMITGNPADAGRGGALADAIALATLFGTRNYGADVYEALTKRSDARKVLLRGLRKPAETTPPTPDKAAEVDGRLLAIEGKFAALEAQLRLDAQGQGQQNFWLAIATAVGTVAWGFGDLIAGPIIRHL